MNANFEKYAHEQLGGHEIAVDAEALWADVAPHVRPEKGNRKLFWFFMFGLLTSLTVFGAFYLSNNVNNEVSLNNNSAQDVSSTLATTSIVKEENITTATNTNKEAIPTTIDKTTKVPVPNTTKAASVFESNASATKARRTAKPKAATSNSASGFDNQANVNESIINSSLPVNNNTGQPVDASLAKEIALIQNYRGANLLPSALNTLDHKLDFAIDISSMATVEEFNLPAKKEKRLPKKPNFFRNMKVGVGVYTGLSKSNSDIEAKNESSEALLLGRINTEKQLETIHFGLNALIQTESNLYLRAGAEYTRMASLFSTASSSTVRDTTIGVVEYRINGITGDTTEILGDIITTTTSEYTKKTYNYFHLIDVPVILGYNFGDVDDEWVIGVEAGIYANVFLTSKGEFSQEDGTFYDIGEDPQEYYRTNVGISPYFGINAAYNVNQNLQIHFTPSFRYNSLFSTDANPLKEQRGNLGVLAGVRYFFD